eukprot:g9735.t1
MRFVSVGLQLSAGVPLRNEAPRGQADSKEVAMKDTGGYIKRTYAAHQNSWEAMILWTSAVLMGKAFGVDEAQMNTSATMWLVSRVVYVAAYSLISTYKASFFRSAWWMVGVGASLHLMVLAALRA